MIAQMDAADAPEFCALALNLMLFKLGGQITFSLVELALNTKDYPKIRVALDVLNEKVTLTLLSDEQVNDRPLGGING